METEAPHSVLQQELEPSVRLAQQSFAAAVDAISVLRKLAGVGAFEHAPREAMANTQHLEILEKGVGVWNLWRKENGGIVPDLANANLADASLLSADFDKVNLSSANLSNANLARASIVSANLTSARLTNANLAGADLSFSDLTTADLCGAVLHGIYLVFAIVRMTRLKRADFAGACIAKVTFADIDLSETNGLEEVKHAGPSSISVDTLYRSQGKIPDRFLREAGMTEEVIDLARSIRNGPPIQWHSCFISYSTKDEEFARRLYSRMREANMRVWFAPEDMKGGQKLHEQVFEAIQLEDRLLLVLSENSIRSEWVMTEIRKAREVERKQKRRKLFPIRLADFDTLRDWTCFDADSGKDLAVEVREYYIPDFSNWKDHDAFEAGFERLQKDLKAGNLDALAGRG